MSIERHEGGVVHVTPMPLAQSEGEVIRRMEGKFPAMVVPMDYGYPRGTHLKLEMEVRVQSYMVDEIRGGQDKGQLVRRHNFVIEEIKIIGAYTADQVDQGVGGTAATEEEYEDGAEPDRGGPEGVDGSSEVGGDDGGLLDPGF